jgi:predicted amidohydrolase YtcJ
MLRQGMLADLTVFTTDPFTVAPPDLLAIDVALTMVDGRIVHRTV